jgi:hypothetical protein
MELEMEGSLDVDHIDDPQVVGYTDVVQDKEGSQTVDFEHNEDFLQSLHVEGTQPYLQNFVVEDHYDF